MAGMDAGGIEEVDGETVGWDGTVDGDGFGAAEGTAGGEGRRLACWILSEESLHDESLLDISFCFAVS